LNARCGDGTDEPLAAIALVEVPPIYFATPASETNGHLIKFMGCGNDFAGEPRRRKMISRGASYHGGAIAGAALGGGNELHERFDIRTVLSVQISHPSWPNAAQLGENEDAFTNRLAGELEHANLEAGPGTIGAIIAKLDQRFHETVRM
jgi:4-aminobutyrate--pyruvate transaminase